MKSCDLPNLTELFQKLIAAGMDIDKAELRVRMRIKSLNSKVSETDLNTLFPDPKVRELTEDERDAIAQMWDKVTSAFTAEFIDTITTSDVNEIFVDILGDDTTEFFDILSVAGLDLRNFQLVQYQHINRLNELKEAHTTLGNLEIVAELEEAIRRETAKLEKRKENSNKLQERMKEKEIKSALIRTLLQIAETIDAKILSADKAIFGPPDLEDERQKLLVKVEELKNLRAKLERAKQNYKLAGPERKSKMKAELKKAKNELGPRIKEVARDAARLQRKIEKDLLTFAKKEFKDRTGKTLSSRDADRAETILLLQTEYYKNQTELVDLNLRSLAQDSRDITRSTAQIIAFQTRLQTIANAGMEMRVNSLIQRIDADNDPTLQEFEETFGKAAYNAVIGSREKVKLPDGSEVLDMSPLTPEEIKRGGQLWKANMIETSYSGFFSEDPADVTEESLNIIENIALGRTIVDSTSPEAVDPTFAPVNTPEQRLAQATPGVIPDANKFTSAEEATRALESTIRRMYSVFGFKYFKGIIPEKVIRQVLHPQLMDINPKAWENARVSYLKPRSLSAIQTSDQIAFRRAIIQAHGGNPDTMPEFSDPNWFTDNSKLVSFDIETFGDITHPENKVDGVYAIQIRVKDGVNPPQTKLLVNSNGTLVDAKLVDASERSPLTKDQITGVMGDLEQFQNLGFKVITHNGNNFDFPQLRRHVTDVDLLARVALRSVDLLANVTEAVPGSTWKEKTLVKGKKLKELGKANLPARAPTVAYGGRIQFTSGYPIDLSRDSAEIKLTSEGITPLWEEASKTGDWYRFDAYSENDADLTIDMFEHMMNSPTGELNLAPEVGTTSIINMGKPLSNLFLNNDNTHIQTSNYHESLGAITSITPKVTNLVESSFYTEESGYDANRVLDLLHSWWVKSLLANPVRNRLKIERLQAGLSKKGMEEVQFDLLHVKVAKENQEAVKPILETKFAKFGFILSLDYSIEGLNRNVVIEDVDRDGNPVMTFNEEGLYSKRVNNPVVYENAVLDSFLKTIKDPTIKSRFALAIQERVKPRAKTVDESDSEYWHSVIRDYLKPLIPGFTSLAQFGNAELDWKPADEVGMAIAQVMMDQKPGATVSDVLIHQGNETKYVLSIDAQAQFNSRGGLGRRKQLVVLSANDVHMAQPHSLIREEKAYEGFRLQQRVNHLLDMEITPTMYREIEDWLQKEIKQQSEDPISFFADQQVLSIIPDVARRGVFTAIPSLRKRAETAYEQLYEVPRLLMSINHDCFYIGINQPQRFLREDLPVFYFDDAINPGGPTAATIMGGAIDQLAWMFNFAMVSDEQLDLIFPSLERGIELLRKEGKDKDGRPLALMRGNKADYAFQGKHNIMAALLTMGGGRDKDGNQLNIADEILRRFGAIDETGAPATTASKKIIVNKKDLGDPRYKVYDLLFGFDETLDDGTVATREGLFEQMLANPDAFGLDEDDKAILGSLNTKLQAIGRTNQIKEFFKGAITPRMYQAGYPGILQGLTERNEKENLGLTDAELEFLTLQLLRAKTISDMNLVDAALGYSSVDLKVLKEILKEAKQRQSGQNLQVYVGPRAFKKAKDRAERLNSMKSWFGRSVEKNAEALAKFEGISPEDTAAMTNFTKSTKERLTTAWLDRLEKAADLWNTRAVEGMSEDEYNTFIYNMNIALAGGEEAMKDHIMLFGLQQRAATPYVLDEEAIRLQQLVSTAHVSSEDYKRWLNREIYFRMGIEAASGRNHMVGWWGVGPQGSKFAQPRVIEGEPSDINQFGLWRIEEIDPATVESFDHAFYRSILMDLARFYRPPDFTGYTGEMESRPLYYQQMEERSAKEIEATELSKYYDSYEESDIVYRGDSFEVISAERKKRNRKISGTATQRARIRTKLTGKESEPIMLDQKVDGIGALRPSYADIDFSQRGIYALVEAQHKARVRDNQSVALNMQIAKGGSSDPNGFVDSNLRGYVSPWGQETMPLIPQSSEDISAVVALGNQSGIQMKAIQLQNVLTDFAKMNGLDQLLENKDWTRIYVIKRLKEQALMPAIRSLRKTKKAGPTTSAFDVELPLREARIKFHDGIIKTAGISSISLSGLKRFSTIDLMAGLEERTLSLEEIQEIKNLYGEEPGWLQVLSWLGTKGKVERLMPMKFGITIDPGVVARGKQGREGIPETTEMPVFSFGREIMHVYHLIQSTSIATKIATEMIKGTKLESTAIFDKNGFVNINSIDGSLDPVLFKKIWDEIVAHKKEIVKELMTRFTFVLDRSMTLKIHSKTDVITTEDETKEALTVQTFTDANAFVKTLVDNPSTLWLFTPEMLTQLLNNITNYRFISDLELSIQTNKEMFQVKNDLDTLVQEEQAQLFERLREDEEDMNDALLFLHTIEPGKTKPLAISDYRKVDYNNIPRQVLDFGGYMVNEAYFRGSQTKAVAEKASNMVKVDLLVTSDGATKHMKKSVSFPTADMPFVTVLVQVMNKGRALGFHEQADQIADFLYTYSRTQREATDSEAVIKKAFSGVNASNVVIKLAAMSFELSGNTEAQESLYRYFNFTNNAQAEKLKPKVNKIVDAMQFIVSTERHEADQAYYYTKALLERQLDVNPGLIRDPAFLDRVSTALGRPVDRGMVHSVKLAVEEVIKPIAEPEISHDMFNSSVSPTVFANPEDFVNSFANPGEREIANKIVSFLDNLVARGIISERVRDLKLMLIGKMSQNNPEFIHEFGLEEINDSSETLMNSAKRNGRYIIGLNFKMAEYTSENELLFSFAEELVHIARVKFVKNDSAEWNNIVGLFSANRSRGMVRELLIAFNQGKPVEDLENKVNYAMSNPDEFFAHVGAFVLLKDVLGNEETLGKLEARFRSLKAATSIWKRAFYLIKGLAKQILVTYAKLRDDPVYSDLYDNAEKAVMAVIGNSHVSRTEANNPDAVFNTYKNSATTLHNKVVDPIRRRDIGILQNEVKVLDQQIQTQRTALNIEKDPVKAATIRADIQSLDSQRTAKINNIRQLDAITFMGVSDSEMMADVDDLIAWQKKNKRRITQRTLLNQGKRRSFLAYFISKGMERRGDRIDTPMTLAHAARNTWFRGAKGEAFINNFIQSKLLNGFNATEYSYNSPFAPMMVLSDLIDQTAATTKGSLASDVGGIENNKYQIDAYAHNVLRIWGEIAAEYPDLSDQQEIVEQAVAYLFSKTMPTVTDPTKQAYIIKLAEATKLMRDRMISLMYKTQLLDVGEGQKVDEFPLKLRNYALLNETEKEQGYGTIKEAMVKKNVDEVTNKGQHAAVSTLVLFTTGALPYLKTGETISRNDSTLIGNILVNIKNGVPTKASTGREAILDYYIRKRAADAVKAGTFPTISTYADQTVGSVMADIQEEITSLGYKNREGSLTFDTAFQGMNSDNMDVLVTEYTTNLSLSSDLEVKNRFDSIKTDEDAISVFNIPNQTIAILPETFDSMSSGDILTIDFLSKMGVSSHLFRKNSFHLNSEDVFVNGAPELKALFDWHGDSLFKSLARGTGYDLVERMAVQEIVGIPGAFFNIEQILQMLESEVNSEGVQAANFHLLDANGTPQETERSKVIMRKGIARIRLALKEARGTLTQDDLDQGTSLAWLASIGRDIVSLRYGPNINFATALVEAPNALLATIAGSDNILNMFMNTLVFGATALEQWGRNTIWNIKDSLPALENGKLRFSPLRKRRLDPMAASALWTSEEALSPMLPQNFNHSGGTSDLVEKMGWWERSMLRRKRSSSNVMRSVRIAAGAAANRNIINLARSGKLAKFRDEFKKVNPQTITGIVKVAEDSGLYLDQEVLINIVRSGLLEGSAIEAIIMGINTFGPYRGTLLDQDMAKWETDLHLGRAGVAKLPRKGLMQTEEAVRQARIAMAKFMDLDIHRSMVVRRSLDAPASTSLSDGLLTFFKSYPALWVTQQLLRRGSLASGWKLGLYISLTGILDLIYNIMLALARGSLSFEDVIEQIKNPKKTKVSDLTRYVLRHPVFSNNPLGLTANAIQLAATGRGSNLVSSVAEGAFNTGVGDLWKLFQHMYRNPAQWDKSTTLAYKALYPVLPNELTSIPVRIIVAQAFGDASAYNTPSSKPSPFSVIMNQHENYYDGTAREVTRSLFKGYDKQKKRGFMDQFRGMKAQDLDYLKPKTQPQVQPQAQPQVQPQAQPQAQPQVPTMSTEVNLPTLKQQATTPIKAPR